MIIIKRRTVNPVQRNTNISVGSASIAPTESAIIIPAKQSFPPLPQKPVFNYTFIVTEAGDQLITEDGKTIIK